MHKIAENNIYNVFHNSIKEYRHLEVQKVREPIQFKVEPFNSENYNTDYDYSGDNLFVDDVLNKVISIVIDKQELKLSEVDSILTKNLEKSGLNVPFKLQVHSNNKNSETQKNHQLYKKGIYITPLEEFNTHIAVSAEFNNVHKVIFGEIIWYLLASLIFTIVITFLVAYQLKTIIKHKKIEQLRQDFVDSMTHEIKNPLQGALSLTQLLDNPSFIDDEQQRNKAISRIKINLKQINSSIESILERSHSEDIRVKPRYSLENIEEHINYITSNISISNNNKVKFNIHFDTPTNLYNYDPVHFPNAIKNIIENGIKYNKKSPEIDIRVLEQDDFLTIIIKDNGVGIEKHNLDLIFKKFYRIESTGYGFGLGLSYVKWVCEIHGGAVSVSSVYGKGSEFILKIRIVK